MCEHIVTGRPQNVPSWALTDSEKNYTTYGEFDRERAVPSIALNDIAPCGKLSRHQPLLLWSDRYRAPA